MIADAGREGKYCCLAGQMEATRLGRIRMRVELGESEIEKDTNYDIVVCKISFLPTLCKRLSNSA